MSPEPQDIEMVKPEARFEPTKARVNGVESDLPTWKIHLLCDSGGSYPALLNGWEQKVLETESKREGFNFWYRNPSQPGQSSLGIAYFHEDQYKIMRPDFIFFVETKQGLMADLVDPHGLQFADALSRLQGLVKYAEIHVSAFRRIVSVAQANGVLRALDIQRPEVRKAIMDATDATSLFKSTIAQDYM